MKILPTSLPGVQQVVPTVFADARGWLFESWSEARWNAAGFSDVWRQTNHSHSIAGVVRGLHYQLGAPQSKLVRVVHGRILDIVMDVRRGSPYFGKWTSVELSKENQVQLYVPPGFAHGFLVLEEADVLYAMSQAWAPADERGVLWTDPALGLPCPANPLLSARDQQMPCLQDIADADLPVWRS